jgi:gliding motility-associated-like protein
LNTVCGQKYCYQVKAIIGVTESVSQLKCVDGKNSVSLPAITDGLVSINNKDVNLSWSVPNGFVAKEVIINKADGLSGVFSEIKKGNLTQYSEILDETKNNPPCFKLTYSDNCGNISPATDSYCPVLLKLNGTELSWNPYEKFTSPSYAMEVSDKAGAFLKNYNVNGVLQFIPNPDDFSVQDLQFRVKTTSNTGKISFSNYKSLSFSLKVLVPSAFTPNGDGDNDTFQIFTAFVKSYQYQIFDRWGNNIFTSQGPNDEWDGRINGQAPQTGTYVYTLTYTSQGGQVFKKDGVISIVL